MEHPATQLEALHTRPVPQGAPSAEVVQLVVLVAGEQTWQALEGLMAFDG